MLEKERRDLDQREQGMLQQHEQAMAELRDASRRLESDFMHQVGQAACREQRLQSNATSCHFSFFLVKSSVLDLLLAPTRPSCRKKR